MKQVVKRPILTEKTSLQSEAGVYTFEVEPSANKIEIASAVSARFGVEVANVRTSWIKAKRKSQFTRKGMMRGKKSSRKKAIVSLKPGNTIDLFAPLEAEKGL